MAAERDPRAVLRERIAAIAQREFEDSITPDGGVAHAEFLGDRIASTVMALFAEVECQGRCQSGRWHGDWDDISHAGEHWQPTHARLVLRTTPEPITGAAE